MKAAGPEHLKLILQNIKSNTMPKFKVVTTTKSTTVSESIVTEIPEEDLYTHYYASPSGVGDGLTEGSPFKIADFLALMGPAKRLWLLDGIYTDFDSMILPAAGINGSEESPVIIKALHDGEARIDAQGMFPPVKLTGNEWIVMEGFDACNAGSGGTHDSTSVIELKNSSNCTLRRICGWEAEDGNSNIFGFHNESNNVLVEDCAGWGTCRKVFSNSQHTDAVTFRRCFWRWEGSIMTGPKEGISLGYNSYNGLAENCIGTWDSLKMPESYNLKNYDGTDVVPTQSYTNYQVNSPQGIFTHDGWDDPLPANGAGIRIFGSIAYLKASQRFHNRSTLPWASTFVYDVKGVEIKDSYSWIEPGSVHDSLHNIHLVNATATPALNSIMNSKIIGGTNAPIEDDWTTSGNTISASCVALGIENLKRYENGVQTADSLWPWPMNQRIKDAMTVGGYASDKRIDVTADCLSLCNGLSFDQAVNLATDWLTATEPERVSIEAQLETYAGDIDAVIDAVKPAPSETATGEQFYQNWIDPRFATQYSEYQYHMFIPPHYAPSTPIGLIICLHAGGSHLVDEIDHIAAYEMDSEEITSRSMCRPETDSTDYILAAPIALFGADLPTQPTHADRWNVPNADQYIMDLITEISGRYNLDFNRIVIVGDSMGGIGTYHMMIRLHDRLATGLAAGGAWEIGNWDLIDTPFYIIHGVTDAHFTPAPCRNHNTPIENARIADQINPAIHLLEYPGDHSFDATADAHWDTFVSEMQSLERNPYPTTVKALNPWRSYEIGSNFADEWTENPSPHTYWITIDGIGAGTIAYPWAKVTGDGSCSSLANFNNWSMTLDSKSLNGGKVVASISGSVITVTTTNVTEFTIWLHPDLLSGNFSVVVNGGAAQNFSLGDSLVTALRSYERRWDWEMIFHRKVTITV